MSDDKIIMEMIAEIMMEDDLVAGCKKAVAIARAENEKLRAAAGSLVRSLSGCWYAFEPSLRREMGNTNYHCVKEKMDEVEVLLDLRADAALKETGGE